MGFQQSLRWQVSPLMETTITFLRPCSDRTPSFLCCVSVSTIDGRCDMLETTFGRVLGLVGREEATSLGCVP